VCGLVFERGPVLDDSLCISYAIALASVLPLGGVLLVMNASVVLVVWRRRRARALSPLIIRYARLIWMHRQAIDQIGARRGRRLGLRAVELAGSRGGPR
jgi:hypothetical protein